MTIKDIEAREKAATVEVLAPWELDGWGNRLDVLLHDASLGTLLRWRQERRALATIDDLLAQLRDREEKLAAVEKFPLAYSLTYRHHNARGSDGPCDCPPCHLYCILKGASDEPQQPD